MKAGAILIVLCMLSVVYTYGKPLPQQKEPQTTSHYDNTQGKQNDPKNTEANEKQSEPLQPPADKKESSPPEKTFDYVFWGFWVNGILVLATLIIAIFAVVQANASKSAVFAMRESNRINLELGQAMQRAYIAFPMLDLQALRVNDANGNPIQWHIRTAVENTGNTPARELDIRINMISITGDGGIPNEFTYPDYRIEKGFPTPLAAKAKIYSPKLTISHDIIRSQHGGQSRLFFYGWASYFDVFDSASVRTTEFCHEIRILEVEPNGLKFEVSAHWDHNSQK
jgi:hypothetical protein